METIEEIAQWVIDNRYPKSENDKVSDFEMYQTLIEAMNQVLRQQPVSERSEQLKAFVDEFIEAWEDGNGGDSYLYRKAKSL
jgi:uncharacterized protein YmfQ (DUF2313 family)